MWKSVVRPFSYSLGLSLVAALLYSERKPDDYIWMAYGFKDKTWLLFLYFVWVVIFPLGIVRRIGTERHIRSKEVKSIKKRFTESPSADSVDRSKARTLSSFLRLSSFLFCLFFICFLWLPRKGLQPNPGLLDTHETVHFKGLQAILSGVTPYIDSASDQYGPGSQFLISYYLNFITYPSVSNIRFAQYLLHFLGLLFFLFVSFLFMKAKNAVLGLVSAIVLYPTFMLFMIHRDGMYVGWWGWGSIWRYAGLFLLSVSIPSIFSAELGRKTRVKAFFVGGVWGITSLIAQENFMGGILVVASLSYLALSARLINITELGKRALPIFFGFTFIVGMYLIPYLMSGNLGKFIRNYFLVPSAVSKGYSNTAWSQEGSWSIAYYLSPYLMIVLMAILAISKPPKSLISPENSQKIANWLSTFSLGLAASVAQAGALTRADSSHLINSFVLFPFFISAWATYFTSLFRQKVLGVAFSTFFILVCAIPFLLPSNFYWVSKNGLLERISIPLSADSKLVKSAKNTPLLDEFERRVSNLERGQELRILNSSKAGRDNVLALARSINLFSGTKSVYLDPQSGSAFGGQVGYWYFASNINPANVPFEESTLAITKKEIEMNWATLLDSPPAVYMTSYPESERSLKLIQRMFPYETYSLAGLDGQKITVIVTK